MRSRQLSVLLALALGLGVSASVRAAENSDPWEGFNRGVFAFNEFMDRNLLKPAAKGYQAVTPDFVDTGVTNVFSNLGEVPSFINHVLQGQVPDAAGDGGRFAVNSTLGLLGLFDVASKMGIEQKNTDFGITLGRWGFEPGPYLVLPFLGPSNIRDAAGRSADFVGYPLYYVEDSTTRWSLRALEIIDTRADLLETEELITGDRYTFLRNLYLQNRKFQISGGEAEPEFDDFEDEFDEEL